MSEVQYDVNELTIYEFFNYWPSLALACVALSLFTLSAVVVGWMTEKTRMRPVHCITVTALMEVGGYAALIYAIERSGKGSVFNAYVAMQVLVIEAPNVLQACMYWTIGKVLSFSPEVTRGRRVLRGWVITTIFACADLLAIIIQAIGISIWAQSQSSGTPDQDQIRLGCGITLAGLALQLIFFLVFTALTIWTHRHPKQGLRGKRETRRLFLGLYLGMGFLYVRNLFRLVEFAQATVLDWPPPEDVYVLSEQQVLFYTLDALPVFLSILCFGILFHPGRLFPATHPDAVADVECGAAAAAAAGAGKLEAGSAKAGGGDSSASTAGEGKGLEAPAAGDPSAAQFVVRAVGEP